MASYQVRQRDPLVDQGTAAMLERRGRELLGLGLLALAFLFFLMLWSYSPEDPGWMVATDEPAANMMGRFGAAFASTLIIIGGMGAWGLPVVLAAWGLRFVLHRGADRALGRMIFAVIAVALGSVYAATLVPGAGWPHSFGLGGLFGDTVLGAALGIVPVGAGVGLKLLSLLSGVALLGMMLFVTGFDLHEVRSLGRFLRHGLIITYSTLVAALGRGASHTARAATATALATATAIADRRKAAALTAAPELVRTAAETAADAYGRPSALRPAALTADARYHEPLAEAPHYAPPRERTGLLARMPQMMRRAEPELIETAPPPAPTDLPTPDRIRSRITDVINARTAAPFAATSPLQAAIAARREPPVVRPPRGPAPLIADTRPPAERFAAERFVAEKPADKPAEHLSRPAPVHRAEPLVAAPAPLAADLNDWDNEDDDPAIAADWETDLPRIAPQLRATPAPQFEIAPRRGAAGSQETSRPLASGAGRGSASPAL